MIGTRDWSGRAVNGWPVSTAALRRLGPYSFHFVPGLPYWLARHRPAADLVGIQSVWQYPNRVMQKWCERRGVPYVITTHGNLNPVALAISRTKKRLAARWLADPLLRGAAALHALNKAEYRNIRRYGLSQPVIIVPNGVRLPEECVVTEEELSQVQARLAGRRCLLYLGRLHPIKGLDDLLKAFAALPSRQDWALALAGPDDGAYRRRLEALAGSLGISASVLFAGPVYGPEKSAWLRSAGFFVLPSRSEGFPMAPLEALAHGVPVLLTEACNFPEAAACGAGIEAGNSLRELSAGLGQALESSPSARRAMGEQGRKLVQRDYSWESVSDRLIRAYEWVLGRAQQPDYVYTR